MMFEIKQEISFIYKDKVEYFSVGVQYPQQELMEKLRPQDLQYFIKNNWVELKQIQEQALENEPQEIQETQYRFELSGYKQANGSAFRKNSIYTETEIKEAGLDIEELMEKEAITWLK